MHHKQSGELSLVLPEDNCEVVYKVNSATTASGNLDYARADMPYATDCNSSRFSLSSEAWFTSSTRTLDYSLADERTENGTRHSDLESAQWLMSMSLKAFPPNISYDGTSTFRGEWDDRYYGVWYLELSVSWLSTVLHEYVQMLNTQSMIAFITDPDGRLVASSDTEIQGWIDGNSSKIMADTCGNVLVMTAANHFKTEYSEYRHINDVATHVGEHISSVNLMPLNTYGNACLPPNAHADRT